MNKNSEIYGDFLRFFKRSSIDRSQLGFLNVFIAPIKFSYLTNLKVIYLRRYVCDVVVLKCYSKRAANESDFCPFLSRYRRLDKWPSIIFLCLLCVTYINSVTHGAFYLVDCKFRPAFTFLDTLSVDFIWKRIVTFSIH